MRLRDRAAVAVAVLLWGYVIGEGIAQLRAIAGELHSLHLALEDQTAVALTMIARANPHTPAPIAEQCASELAGGIRCDLPAGHDGMHHATAGTVKGSQLH